MTTRSLLLAALAALAATPSAAQAPRRIALADALRLAAENSPAMVQARQDLRVAGWGERTALAAFLPTVTSSASGSKAGSERYNQATGQRVVNPFPFSEQYGLNARMDLFTGFRRGANRRSAAATTDLRDATRVRQEYAVALTTKQAFFNALAAMELVAVAETRLRRAGEQLNLVSEKLRLGATTRSDSLRSRVEYGNAQLTLIQARADQRNTQASLGRAVGVEGLVAPVPDTTLETRLGPLDTAALRRARRRRRSGRRRRASPRPARASPRRGRSGSRPSRPPPARAGPAPPAASGTRSRSSRSGASGSRSATPSSTASAANRASRRPMPTSSRPTPGSATRGSRSMRASPRPSPRSTPRRPRSTSPARRWRRPRRTCGCSASATAWAPPRSSTS